MLKKIKNYLTNFVSLVALSNLSKITLRQRYFLALMAIVSISLPMHSASAAGLLWGKIADSMLIVVYAIMYIIFFVLLRFVALLVYLGAYFVDIMLDPGIYASVFDLSDPNSAMMTGWSIMRDFSNTFFIFILLIIAFSTILRISKYNAKNLLLKFFIALVLINFSAMITLIVIDLGQVFMYEIIGWMGNGFGGNNGAMGNLTAVMKDFLEINKPGTENFFNYDSVVGIIFAVVFSLILGIVYFMLAIFLLIRLVILAILVVLSPVAFLGIVMPGLSSHAGTWWKKLFEYSLFGPIFVFFVFLSGEMSKTAFTNTVPITDLGVMAGLVTSLIPFVISLAMLLAVVPVTKQLGMAGAGAVMGGTMGVGKALQTARGVGRKGFGYAKKAGGVAKERSEHVRRAHETVKNIVNEKGLDKLPGGKVRKQKRVATDEKKKEEKMKTVRETAGPVESRDYELEKEIATSKVKEGHIPATPEQKASFLENAVDKGKVKDDKKVIQGLMPAMESALSKKEMKDLTHKDLTLATITKDSQKRIETGRKGDINSDDLDKKWDKDLAAQYRAVNADGSLDEKEKKEKRVEIVEEQIMTETITEMIEDGKDVSKLNNLGDKRVARVINKNLDSDGMKSFKGKLSKKQQKEFGEGLGRNAKTQAELADLQTQAATGTEPEQKRAKEALKNDEKIKIDAVNFGADLEKTFGKAGVGFEKHIKNAFGKFDPKIVAKFGDANLKKYGESVTASQVRRMFREGHEDEVKVIRNAKAANPNRESREPREEVEMIDSLMSGKNF